MSDMVLELSDDAKEYGHQALRAFEAAGGDQLVQQAEAKPDLRESLAGPVLSELGAWELDPRTDADGLEAAAALCRSAGYWALPYPVAERLAKPSDLDVDGLIVVADNRPSGVLVGLESDWATVSLAGERRVVGRGPAGPGFVAELELAAIDDHGTDDVALGLVLPCWTLLGMLDRAMELTIAHVRLRKQFGQPLSAFQRVQFQLTDAEVERAAEWRSSRSTRCGASAPSRRRQPMTPWRCGCRRSRPPRSCSGSATSCTARSGSAMRPPCRGCPATVSRYAGCRSGCRQRVTN